MKFLYVFFFLGSVAMRLVAQEIDDNNFTCFTEKQGLSGNNITGMAQDATGYLWISTSTGLNRFNGSNFEQFHSSNDSNSLPSEYLTGLVWLDKYHLAAYTNGLHIIDTRTGAARNLFVPYHDLRYQYKFNYITGVTGNGKGEIFFVTRSGFYHFNKDHQLVFRFDYYKKEEVPTTSFGYGRRLVWLGPDALAIISTYGIYYYNLAKKQYKKMEAADCPLFAGFLAYPNKSLEFFQTSRDRLFVVNIDKDSLVYLDFSHRTITANPLPRYTAKEFTWRSTLVQVNDSLCYLTCALSGFYAVHVNAATGKLVLDPKKYFPFYYCRALLADRDHQLWVATSKGLFRQDDSRQHVQQAMIPQPLQELFPNIVIDDLCAAGNNLYVATRGYGGLLVYDKQKMEYLHRISFEKCFRNPNGIYALSAVGDNTVWVGTNGPVFSLNTKNYRLTEVPLYKFDRQFDWIADIYKDSKKNIWIANDSIYRYKPATKQFDLIAVNTPPFNRIQRPNSMAEDAAGNIWIAGHGLIRYNTGAGKFDLQIDSFPYIKMPDRQVVSFAIDHRNNCWINSYNNGLICYDPNKRTYRHFTRDNGLPDNNISSMIVIGNQLWLACLTGIACLDLNRFTITSFGKEDGFPEASINNGAEFLYDSAQHKLYIGYRTILVRFDPNIIYQKSPAPHLFIESITTGDQRKHLFPPKKFITSWPNNEITISIGSINFTSGNSQRFAYRLLKADSSRWQQLGIQNTFSVSNLAAGTHRIQAMVYSVNNRWPAQIQEIDVTVLPPFWQQTWFTATGLLLLPLLVYGLIHWRTEAIRKKDSINQQLAEAQLLALQTQMNPHFIFNSLNSIKGMILENQQEQASRYLSKFARIIRMTLQQSKEIFTTLYENIEYIESYLLMEKLRFGDSFTYRIVVDEDIDKEAVLVPTLMIQPLAENAIWHGLMHRQGEKKLEIHFSRQADFISCTIEDNGIGIDRSEQLKRVNKPPHQSVGLSNLRHRIMIMNEKYDTGCTLTISDQSVNGAKKTGTRAVLRFTTMYKKPLL